MLRSIKEIKGYRIFSDFMWPDDLHRFEKFNLIYGLNGSGKTTLTTIFSDLAHCRPSNADSVLFDFDSGSVNGKSPQSGNVPPIKVFNRAFVQHAIFEDPAKQELAPVFYLGEDSVEKQQQVAKLKHRLQALEPDTEELAKRLKADQRSFEQYCSQTAASIKNALTKPGGKFNNFNRAEYVRKIDTLSSTDLKRLSEPEREELLGVAHSQPMKDISKVSLPSIDYMDLIQRAEKLLAKSVTASVIQVLADDPRLGQWVQSGLDLHKADEERQNCFFCEQELPPGRLDELESHFNDELNRFQAELDAEIKQIESAKSTIQNFQLPAAGLFYQHCQDELSKYAARWSSSKQNVSNFLDVLLGALKRKRDKPFEKMDLRNAMFVFSEMAKDSNLLLKIVSMFLDASQSIVAISGLQDIERINALIERHNAHSASFGKRVQEAMDRVADDMILESLDEYQKYLSDLESLSSSVTSQGGEIQAIKTEIQQLEREMRQHRAAAEELTEELAAYLGRSELSFQTSESGYRLFRYGEPAYHLSEGERTAIAFMYFLKTLEDESFDLEKAILVIDDPISSLDSNSLYSAFSFMKRKTESAAQLFVLTHNFQLFRLVRGWLKKSFMRKSNPDRHDARIYLLEPHWNDGKRRSTLANIDPLLRDFDSEYHYLFKQIWDVLQIDGRVPLERYYILPNVGRRLLESFLSFKFPGKEPRLDELMAKADFDPVKKTRLLRFLHAHSHFDRVSAPEHDLSTLGESPVVFFDLLDMIKTLDEDHYHGLVASLK